MENNISSMETILAHRFGLLLLTAVAPAAWGTTYIVTEQFLPPDRPLFAALVRALPVGLVLLALRRRLPRGDWWWKATVLGLCNIGLFFPLIFLAAYHLPGGLAATAPGDLTARGDGARLAAHRRAPRPRPRRRRPGRAGRRHAAGAPQPRARSTTLGLAGALGSVLVSALGFVLIKRWPPPVDMLTLVSWQLVVGGLRCCRSGWSSRVPRRRSTSRPPSASPGSRSSAPDWPTSAGSAGSRAMPAGAVSLIGLINPVVGTALGVVVAGRCSAGSRRSACCSCSAAWCRPAHRRPPHPGRCTARSTRAARGRRGARPHEASRPCEASTARGAGRRPSRSLRRWGGDGLGGLPLPRHRPGGVRTLASSARSGTAR